MGVFCIFGYNNYLSLLKSVKIDNIFQGGCVMGLVDNSVLDEDFCLNNAIESKLIKFKDIDQVLDFLKTAELEASKIEEFDLVDGRISSYDGHDDLVVIPKGIIGIGHRAFSRDNNLKAVLIPETVVSIESDAFADCINLEIVVMSQNVEYIGDSAFSNCDHLRIINLSDKLDIIKESTFEGCASLSSIKLPTELTIIEEAAFAYSGLIEVHIPDQVRYIGMFAFEGCAKLKTVYLPDGLTVIEEQVFSECGNLTNVSIPDSVVTIKEYAFEATGLPLIILPDSLISLRPCAFKNCTYLTKVVSFRDFIFFKKQNSRIFENCFSLSDDEMLQNKMYQAYLDLSLAHHYIHTKDYKAAYKHLELSAAAAYGPAFATLAYLEFLGANGEVNKAKGIEYLKAGAALENPHCIYNLACCYINGEGGLDEDLNEALRLAKLADKYGFAGAEELIDSIHQALRAC